MKPLIMVVLCLLVFAPPPPTALAHSKSEKVLTTETHSVGKGLVVAPTRLEFSGRIRSQIFKILNKDPRANTYRISFVSLLKTDKGKDASKFLKFSPRRVRVKSGKNQTIRVVVKKPRGLEPGTYTARMMIRAIPPPRRKKVVDDNISVTIDVVYSVTIPIIIHHNP